MKKVSALALAFLLVGSNAAADDLEPYITGSKKSKHQKVIFDQNDGTGWQFFAGIRPFQLDGKRALFFAQLHLRCTKQPNSVKIRLARIHADGSLDTTGTNTWVLGKNAPKTFQGSLWWESLTKYPITAQFKVNGGKCVSTQRQLKFWQP